MPRRLLSEALGTAMLVATVVGSGIMAERLAGGNEAIALLGNTIPTGAILVVIITVLGPVSGAHFNPAVTLVFAARGKTPWREVVPYVVVQCRRHRRDRAGAPDVRSCAARHRHHARGGLAQWLAETVATFTLVLAILGGLRPRRKPYRGWSG